MKDTEKWLPVPVEPYNLAYEVSNFGRVRRIAPGPNTAPGYILAPDRDYLRKRGYHRYTLSYNSKILNRGSHDLVARAFLGPPPSDAHVPNHKDGDKSNNCPDNLEWVTPEENIRHRFEVLGHIGKRGESNPLAVLTKEQAKKIRALYGSGKFSYREIGEMMNVSPGCIQAVCEGINWGLGPKISRPKSEVYVKGDRHPGAKLTAEQVLEIREQYPQRTCTRAAFAKRYGISESNLKAIMARRLWKHI